MSPLKNDSQKMTSRHFSYNIHIITRVLQSIKANSPFNAQYAEFCLKNEFLKQNFFIIVVPFLKSDDNNPGNDLILDYLNIEGYKDVN